MEELKVEYISLTDIAPYENNAKIHTEEQIEQIKKSIEEFGFNDPIATWHGTIVEGHGRYEAAKQLGIEKVPVINLDGLTDEQRRAYTLVHNKLTMNTGFDFSALSKELQELEEIDMHDFGFSDFEMFTDDEEIVPESFDNDELKEYGEGKTVSTVITITCQSEDEVGFMKTLLKEVGDLRKLYRANVIIERYEEDHS